MSAPYDEVFEGETFRRKAPDARHERICERLHSLVRDSITAYPSARQLPARTIIELSTGTFVRPDLALVTAATGRIWLAVEVISAQDHRLDTVNKKSLYEESKLPRLWMVDTRYDNVEVYHGTAYGLALKEILAGAQRLEDRLLPSFGIVIKDLFAEA